MENTELKNDVMLESAARIIKIEDGNAEFYIKNGFLALKANIDGEEKNFDRVFLHRDFPHELLWEYTPHLTHIRTQRLFHRCAPCVQKRDRAGFGAGDQDLAHHLSARLHRPKNGGGMCACHPWWRRCCREFFPGAQQHPIPL